MLQVVSAYLWRAPVDMLDEFLKEDGLFLLANQLSAYPVCQLQVEAAFSLMLQHSFTFQDWSVDQQLFPYKLKNL